VVATWIERLAGAELAQRRQLVARIDRHSMAPAGTAAPSHAAAQEVRDDLAGRERIGSESGHPAELAAPARSSGSWLVPVGALVALAALAALASLLVVRLRGGSTIANELASATASATAQASSAAVGAQPANVGADAVDAPVPSGTSGTPSAAVARPSGAKRPPRAAGAKPSTSASTTATPCVRSWTDDAGIKRYNADCPP
jgi:hypothetical protein